MAFHQVHGLWPIEQAAERGTHRDFLGDTGGLDHTQMVVACAHAGDDRLDRSPSLAGQALALDDDHAPAFAEDQPVSFGIEGAAGFARRPRPSRQPVKSAQGGEFQKMQVREIILAAADDGGVDDAVGRPPQLSAPRCRANSSMPKPLSSQNPCQ